jgi:rod shape-determining protein MreD
VRSVVYLLSGLFLILLQGTSHRFLVGLEGISVGNWNVGDLLHGATPSLVLPMVVYLGIHEPSMARGSLLAFGLGWGVDIIGGGPAFLFRFTMVAIWWISRAASTRVSTQSTVMRIPLALSASLIESAIVLTLLAIFGADNRRPLELSSVVLPRAISTALFSPFVFSIAHRLLGENWGSSGASSATGSN